MPGDTRKSCPSVPERAAAPARGCARCRRERARPGSHRATALAGGRFGSRCACALVRFTHHSRRTPARGHAGPRAHGCARKRALRATRLRSPGGDSGRGHTAVLVLKPRSCRCKCAARPELSPASNYGPSVAQDETSQHAHASGAHRANCQRLSASRPFAPARIYRDRGGRLPLRVPERMGACSPTALTACAPNSPCAISAPTHLIAVATTTEHLPPRNADKTREGNRPALRGPGGGGAGTAHNR